MKEKNINKFQTYRENAANDLTWEEVDAELQNDVAFYQQLFKGLKDHEDLNIPHDFSKKVMTRIKASRVWRPSWFFYFACIMIGFLIFGLGLVCSTALNVVPISINLHDVLAYKGVFIFIVTGFVLIQFFDHKFIDASS